MKKKKEVTIYDLAKELKFSPSTISRALNNHKSISQKTTKEIQKIAKQLGYRPNTLAASLRNNKSKTIGILIARINRPFIASIISGVEETARKAGYNVIISQSNDKYENEIANAKAMYDSRVTGLIVSLGMETRDSQHFKQFIDQNIPLVFVDRVPVEFNSYRVIIDNYTAGYKATQHLIDQGCKRIAHFAGAQHLNVYNLRKKGYLDALRENNLEVAEELIIDLDTMSFEEGCDGTKALLNLPQPPDGLFSSNDTAAVSAILTAKARGIKIPEELAIIGFNDDPMASVVEPALSTVSHPAVKMGEISAQRILEHSSKKLDSNISEITMLDTEIIIRSSSNRINTTRLLETS
ncbi:LacI family DNA-binding transcriptional regulator [Salegentibacter sp. F188]|uniref:LacI family DNA-binding transcriptional regulator n=1 Tax=Autumnicola patrickiae TaxID=3075591 RepID=A0ABU3E312_9FLAO|nr:LacI family DNA-binding transcriptional regulator [Salegentibacter sp. F188]MDT0690386.1 LacI family DNA-binding transcriptional regulator [Salegentibacter sp. F188]